ncbi:restriction endonuclease subunit S (plasmid) [Bacillus tropicus]|uniref:restriction endonuclease subunit S n=1 Tax=Bacillus tropicus TaxID=2026188 RepID=UPI0020029A1C|nr:restriction endonuclease subunit S [Bacillus tropicus]UOK49055.1 restriction endonuclease subunit S [Bacillus tropicus]
MKFETIKLEEAILLANTGADAIKRAPIVDYETKFRCLRIGDISNNRPFEKWGYTSADEKIQKKFKLTQNDILIARTGNTIGVATIIEKSLNSVFNNGLIRLKIKESFNPRYIYYLVTSNLFKGFISQISGGTSTQPNVKIQHVLQFPIPNISLDLQNKIASLLEKLDKKINNNISIIDNLEQLSQTLFKYWFIDFEFPNELGQPYKSSGGEMMEIELGEIPITFNTGTIKDFCELKYGKALTKKNRIPGSYPVYGSGGITGTHKEYLIKGPGLIIGRKGSIGTLYLEANNFYPIDTVYYVESKTYPINFLHQFFKQYDFSQANNDSAVPGLNREFVYNTKAIIPDSVLVRKFEEILNPMYEKINNLLKENQQLSELRDTLLSKLLSGEIEIPDELVVD